MNFWVIVLFVFAFHLTVSMLGLQTCAIASDCCMDSGAHTQAVRLAQLLSRDIVSHLTGTAFFEVY